MAARKTAGARPDRLTVTIDADHRDRLEGLAEKTDRSLAWHVREAIKHYLKLRAKAD